MLNRHRQLRPPDAAHAQTGVNVFGADRDRRDRILHALDDGEIGRGRIPEPEGAALTPIMRSAQSPAHRLDGRLRSVRAEVEDLDRDQLAGVVGDGGQQRAFAAAPVGQPAQLCFGVAGDRIEAAAGEVGRRLRNIRDWRGASPQCLDEGGPLGVNQRLLRLVFVGVVIAAEAAIARMPIEPGLRDGDRGFGAAMQVDEQA